MSVLRSLAKLRGRSRAELAERSAQWLTASAERWGIRPSRELQPSKLEKTLDPALLVGEASFATWLQRHRQGGPTPFFAGLADRRATVAAIGDLTPNAEREVLDRAERMLTGEFDLLGFRGLRLPLPIDWHRDPVSGVRAPLEHWSQIDYLDPKVAGDHKAVWEINRHHILVTFGQAYWLTGDERWASQALDRLDEWMDANPPKLGVNWASSLEVSFRSIAWVWLLQLVRESSHLTQERFTRAIGFLTLSARHLERFLSTYFSPNTHLTGEALGLYVLGTQLAPLQEAARWRERGLKILLDQLPRHVRSDGVYFEQATYYHRYTVDFYLHLLILAERCGDRVGDEVPSLLHRLVGCLQAIERPDGTIPLIGDDDGGRLLFLDGRGGEDVRAPLATAAVLFNHDEFAYGAQAPGAELIWLLGPSGVARWRQLKPRPPAEGSRAFVTGGLYVMRDRWSADASVMVIDCGPHGVFNCGHAHADALAFDLTVDGTAVLVDPGTFTYTAPAEWRDYFRSTAVHNTVSINDQSSSVMEGPFAWQSIATSTLERWHATDTVDYFEGAHDGYDRQTMRVDVRRQVLYAKAGYWIVRDLVSGQPEFDATATFQAAPELSMTPHANGTFIVQSTTRDVLRVQVLGSEIRANVESGWVSRAYGVKTEAPRLRLNVTASTSASFHTVLSAARLDAHALRHSHDSGDIIEVRVGEFVDRTAFGHDGQQVTIEGVDTDADIVFLRRLTATGQACEVFASGATRLTVDGIVVATSPVPAVFAHSRPAGSQEWNRRKVGATAAAINETLGSASDTAGSAHDDTRTPSVEVPYYSG